MNVVAGLVADGHVCARPRRRVREEVKDGLAVVAFSAVASSVLAAALLLLTALAS
ncbi:MAG TPA: hypothetical protein VNP20_22320 [Nocardioidaceae bacterium]|nr:hypothetical protein [Nocardioidaceae bacterium]